MRLVTYEKDGAAGVGVRVDGTIAPVGYASMHELIRAGETGLERARAASAGSERVEPDRLLAPIVPGKLLFCGVNYASHKEENPDAVLPSEPFFFSKLPSAVVGPDEPIVIPRSETHTDYEVELALIIARRARNVSRADALDHVFGYTVANDVSARDIQFKESQITIGKNPDTFSPLGPELVTADELDPSACVVSTRVNGEVRQSEPTANMIFSAPQLIEFLTSLITLEPGDLVTTGTPAGVAAFRPDKPWLRPGDEVVVEVDRIGALRNPVVAGW
jgi:2-keto-4-pentenoate hydratase/2-oxohepta-3-ene-1,7-dioic acid hydratase in catechol pathway